MLQCRRKYRQDASKASENTIVLTMDFSQNLTLPNVPDTPSGWYFLSLIAVSLFSVYSANTQKHTSYIYTERKGGKGANEIASMLHNAVELHGCLDLASEHPSTLIVWADNRSDQNKNSFVLWYLMFLVDCDLFSDVSLKFLIKGHTKNPCDRGFGYVKKHVLNNPCWNVKELVDCVGRSSTAVDVINLEDEQQPFRDFKSFLGGYYNKLREIRQYQLFRISSAKKGFVECRRTPASDPVLVDLRCRAADFPPLPVALATIPPLRDRTMNPKKVADFHNKVLPYVPDEYKDDPLYQAPSESELLQACEVKKQRRQAQVKKRRLNDEGKESAI